MKVRPRLRLRWYKPKTVVPDATAPLLLLSNRPLSLPLEEAELIHDITA